MLQCSHNNYILQKLESVNEAVHSRQNSLWQLVLLSNLHFSFTITGFTMMITTTQIHHYNYIQDQHRILEGQTQFAMACELNMESALALFTQLPNIDDLQTSLFARMNKDGANDIWQQHLSETIVHLMKIFHSMIISVTSFFFLSSTSIYIIGIPYSLPYTQP